MDNNYYLIMEIQVKIMWSEAVVTTRQINWTYKFTDVHEELVFNHGPMRRSAHAMFKVGAESWERCNIVAHSWLEMNDSIV